jgi:hypothetical protein
MSQNWRRRFAESTINQEAFDEIVELAARLTAYTNQLRR